MALGGSALAEMTLQYSDHDPPGAMRTGFNKDVWLPEIEKQTGGEVKIQDFFGGALLGSKEILKGIGDGVTDLGFAYPGNCWPTTSTTCSPAGPKSTRTWSGYGARSMRRFPHSKRS